MTRQINLSSIAQKIKNVFRAMPRPPALPQRKPVGEGHRGIAAGDLAERHRRIREGEEPYSPEEIQKWRRLTGKTAEAFVYEGAFLPVHSSNVAGFQYHLEDQKLMVEYLDGSVYLYSGVTVDEAIELTQAQSKGSAVWDILRLRGSKTGHKKPYVKIR